METKQIFFVTMRYWILLLILAILGAGIGFFSVYFAKPVYEADTKLYVTKNVQETGDSLNEDDFKFSQYLVQQYTQIISSRAVTFAILEDVKEFNVSAIQLQKMIKIVSSDTSNIFTISARDPNPAVAAAVANATANQFTVKLNQLTNSSAVGILDEAVIPTESVPSYLAVKIILGILIGCMIALGSIFLMEYFDSSIRSIEDIEKELDLQVIGLIPEHDIR